MRALELGARPVFGERARVVVREKGGALKGVPPARVVESRLAREKQVQG
jgi:hypothetical protein